MTPAGRLTIRVVGEHHQQEQASEDELDRRQRERGAEVGDERRAYQQLADCNVGRATLDQEA
jgi:hypothetical protein